jgi:RNA polymerase sigma-70 factor (sigma-E family)
VPESDDVPILEVRETFDAFYEREYRSVVGLAYALSGSRSGAEDIAQDAFLAAYRRWDDIARYEKPGAWVRRVVANMAVSFFRRSISEARALARLASLRHENLAPLPEEASEFWKAVRALSRRQAQVIALRYLEDLSIAGIARTLDLAEGTVKAHLHRGSRLLASRLGLTVQGLE